MKLPFENYSYNFLFIVKYFFIEKGEIMSIEKILRITTTFITSYFGYFLGGFDIMLQTLILFIIIDYLTGIMSAFSNKNLSSYIGFKGIFKKVIILFLVAVATRIELILGINEIRYIVISFYLVNEVLSILENSFAMGIPVPEKIVSVLKEYKKDNEIKEVNINE